MASRSEDEGLEAPSPKLSPEATSLGITPKTVGMRGNGRFPTQHWTSKVPQGRRTILNGILYDRAPDRAPDALAKIVIAGLSEDEQPRLDLNPPDRLDDESAEKYADRLRAGKSKLIDWASAYYGAELGDGQASLRNLYTETAIRAEELRKAAHQLKTQAEYTAATRKLAELSADFQIREQEIIKTGPREAHHRRYGRDILGTIISRRALQKKVQWTLEARYMSQLRALGKSAPPPMILGDTEQRRRLLIPFPHALGALLQQQNVRTVYQWLGEPATVGYEGRVFVAEHDAWGIEFDLALGLDAFKHTSIVAGIWRIEVQDADIQTFVDSNPQPVHTYRQRLTSARFAGWRIGNGCSGTYDRWDTLTQFFAFMNLSYDEVEKFLLGYYPTAAGKYYPIRGVAYSIGTYGFDWLCHQSANAYSLLKFGVTPVSYWSSVNLFGFYGDLGISTRKDPVWQTEPHFGCVPGVWCHYNVTPPHGIVEPVTVAALENQMTGAGYNLETLWNPNNGWIASRADYEPVAIPIPGWDETIYVDNVP